MITLANRSVGMRCTLLDPQARACVADGRSGDAARHDASWMDTARFQDEIDRREIDLLEAETSESRARAFNVVSALPPPPICSHI